MADLTPETLAAWRKGAEYDRASGFGLGWPARIIALLDALATQHDRTKQAEAERDKWQRRADQNEEWWRNAEAALSRVLADMEALGMRNDGITDTDGGRWVPCADVLDLIEKYRAAGER